MPGRPFVVPMSLRQLLTNAHEDPAVSALADAAQSKPQRAFVSASLRPYLLASLLDSEPVRPALVVAGDDRAARDLAADLREFLSPRVVRFYPARGVRYESHLAPPPHLVGLRVAALDALLEPQGGEGAVVVASASALAEKVPDPELRPHGFAIARGDLLDLDEVVDGRERVVALARQVGRSQPGGNALEQPIGVVVEVSDGKVRRLWTYLSWDTALEAEGLEPRG